MRSGISIVVCTFNGVQRLPSTLQHLFKQETRENFFWEVIIVDNASTDNTQEVVKKLISKYQNFNLVRENNPGKTNALTTGFNLARYEYILVCDDDNWLDEDYIQRSYEIMRDNLEIGVLGGRGEAIFDVIPPKWFYENQAAYAVGKQGSFSGDVTEARGYVWGAGMIFRRDIWVRLKLLSFKPVLVDRKGSLLSSGGDYELCSAARLLGYSIHYSEDLIFKHFISKEKLTWKYFRRLRRGLGHSNSYTELYEYVLKRRNNEAISSYPFTKKLFADLIYFFSSFKRLYFFFFKDLEGEVYFINYEYIWGRIISSMELITSYKSLIKEVENTFKILPTGKSF